MSFEWNLASCLCIFHVAKTLEISKRQFERVQTNNLRTPFAFTVICVTLCVLFVQWEQYLFIANWNMRIVPV